MRINPEIFRGYDLRGIAGKDLNPEIVFHLGRAYGTFLQKRHLTKAVIGRDCRQTSPEYSAALARGLQETGIDVVDIGLSLVGIFYWAQYYLKIPGGAFVTASHNPPEYNGFKFANGFSETLVSQEIQELREIAEKEEYFSPSQKGEKKEVDVQEAYFQDLQKRIPAFKHKFKIVLDSSHATAGQIAPLLLERFGCEVIKKNCNIDPSFPLGTPDPTENKVAQRLKKEVLASQADIGFSYDADGDRIGIVDEKGTIIWNDILVALFAIDVLHRHPGAKIMYNTLCSRLVKETIEKYGGQPFMWRTGHSFLKKKNQEVKAAFIGELSGHFFFSQDFYNHDDGLYSTLRLLSYLDRTNQTLHQAYKQLPVYISSPEIKVGCPDDLKVGLIKKIAQKLRQDFPQAEVIDDERAGDGVRLELAEEMFVVRYSQNGPYLTIKFEAKTKQGYEKLRQYLAKLLQSYPEIDWSYGVNVENLKTA